MQLPAALAGWSSRLREATGQLLEELRRADRYSRMRAGVVGGWALISLVTLFASCPSAGPGNSLGADASVLGESFVGGAQVMVRNDSGDTWTNVALTVDGEWRYKQPTLRSKDRAVVPVTQFRRGEDTLPPDHRPRRLDVDCDQGSSSFELR